MLNKYLRMDPIPWLTDSENPAVTYLVKDEILEVQEKNEIYTDLINSALTDYFKFNSSKGILGDPKHPDVFYKGTVWFFLLAVESGYKHSADFISASADYICKTTQLDDGGFKFNHDSSSVGCRSGNLIYALIKSGISDSRTDAGIKWILKNQRNDGGWLHCPVAGFCDVMKLIFFRKSGNNLKYESDDKISSCPVASYSCLKALIESNNENYNQEVIKGADFFIRNNFFLKSNNKLFCGNKIVPDRIGYPVMSQYDFLSGLILIAATGKWNDPVTGELFNRIIKNQNINGSWNCENKSPGMIKEKPGQSRWATLNALRLINEITKKENQFEKA
jgi:hypothetical protein